MCNIRRLLLVLFIIVLVALVLFFVLENQQSVVRVFFGWAAPAVPVAALVLAALGAGLAVGSLLVSIILLKGRRGLS